MQRQVILDRISITKKSIVNELKKDKQGMFKYIKARLTMAKRTVWKDGVINKDPFRSVMSTSSTYQDDHY